MFPGMICRHASRNRGGVLENLSADFPDSFPEGCPDGFLETFPECLPAGFPGAFLESLSEGLPECFLKLFSGFPVSGRLPGRPEYIGRRLDDVTFH